MSNNELNFEQDASLRDIPRDELDKLLVKAIELRLAQDDGNALRRKLVGFVMESRTSQGELRRMMREYFPMTHDGEFVTPEQ